MAASVPAFPTKFQEITIASNINCSMIQNFLLEGVYTVVYGVTVHVYPLTIAVTVIDVLFQTFTTPAQAESLNSLTIALAFISLAITATATSLIGYRIYSTSKGNTIMQAKKRYTRIIILIVESSAVYSLLLLLFGIVLAVPAFNQIDSSVGPLGAYLQTFLTATPGLVPTVMVARLAFQDENTDYETSHMSVDVSNLNFDNRQAGHETSSPHETDFALNPTTHNETENSPAENLKDNITHEKRSD
ncbi:hypothetical protein JR316_0007548 [Psilocybe cubensis]|uniref:Uncharacterized protein n=1 Tax=Psilocybe cubensis TaxID=181762 RepID=A0ACB8H0C5_PSICU|nr:hypothetical protein JR316_0007548 [Psilocybe cubensis]KAH9480941.1 hypothetical protein JR316_0007548 [Psilocybe cubensis]